MKIISKNSEQGFTLIEVLISLALGMLVTTLLGEIFLANQRCLQKQIDVSTLIARTRRATDILRSEVHLAKDTSQVIGNQLLVNNKKYFVEKNKLIMVENNQRHRLVEQVSRMQIFKTSNLIDIELEVHANKLEQTIHVISAIK